MAEKITAKKQLYLAIPLVIAAVIIALILPRKGSFGLEYTKGTIWRHDNLTAAFEFPLLKSQDEIKREKEEIEAKKALYFIYSENIGDEAIARIQATDLGRFENRKREIISTVAEIYADSGIIAEEFASNTGRLIFIKRGKQTIKLPIDEVYAHSEAIDEASYSLYSILGDSSEVVTTQLKNINFITPNLIFDEVTTSMALQSALNNVSPTKGLVKGGTLIVKNGDIITEEVASYIESYKEEYNKHVGYNGPIWLLWLGNSLMALIMMILFALFIQSYDQKTFGRINRYYYLITIFVLMVITIILCDRFLKEYFLAIPFVIFALYLLAFFKRSIIIPTYVLALTPMLILDEYGVQAYLLNLLAGCVGIYSFQYFYKGYQQFITSILIFLSMSLIYATANLVNGRVFEPMAFVFFAISSVSTILLYPLVYIFEKAFNLVSSSRLKDLCETSNNPLLRELSTNASGTFHHSEQVANIAAAAAAQIGADVDLVRAGAMYHDIGKLYAPNCFVENQAQGDNSFHKDLTPAESAAAIIRHVQEGVEMAQDHNLPKVLIDMIRTHHGTTTANYFYTQYLNAGGSEEDKHLFTYPGPTPKSKEEVILMICDTLEAASRSLHDYKPATLEQLVENIFDQKMDEGQFGEAEISLEDLQILKTFLPKYLSDSFHGRIAYPKRKKNNK